MKKIIYSYFFKTLAALLFVACIVLGAFTVTQTMIRYSQEERGVYCFEEDFLDVNIFYGYLWNSVDAVLNGYDDVYKDSGSDVRKVDDKAVALRIEHYLQTTYFYDKIDYYVDWNGHKLTNCNAEDSSQFMSKPFHSVIIVDSENGNVYDTPDNWFNHSLLQKLEEEDDSKTITVAVSIKDSYTEECRLLWEKQARYINEAVLYVICFALCAVVMLVYLICVCGKGSDGECRPLWIDNVWVEIHLALLGVVSVGAVIWIIEAFDAFLFSNHASIRSDVLIILVTAIAAAASSLIITSLLSIVRNIKCRRMLKTSIVIMAVIFVWKLFFAIIKWLRRTVKSVFGIMIGALSRKTAVILIIMLLIYTVLLCVCALLMTETAWGLVFAIIIFAVASIVIGYRSNDIDGLKKGAREVRSGNLSYKIPDMKCEDLRRFAEDINDIAKGLDESVSAKVKAERMKTELITNVSHDLKTPLTSIINYTQLLSELDGMSEEAMDYVKIIESKGNRLKTLTQDLFDISKVQSGNENVSLEKIDIGLLIEQSMGEHDSDIIESGLVFCVNVPKNLYIFADGRKMSRVISNLINNILKYTMKNTRVFISANRVGDDIVTELKNISSYPMDFSEDEIVGRFVRGDHSRTTEGSGLGLAIAKSYTELCGGRFDIITDGDMFKALITFRSCD